MNSGQLRHRIIIQVATEVQAATTGEVTKTWATWQTVWASIEPISGREYWQAQQTHAELTHKLRIRYLPSLTVRHRVLFGTRVLEINAVQNLDERNIEMVLLCREAVE